MKGKPFARDGKTHPWAFMEKFEIPNLDNPTETYLTRWRIIQTPFASLYLHRMDGPDSRADLHDHPWSFLSIILWGGYVEHRLNLHTRIAEFKTRRHFNIMRRDDAHYIDQLLRTPTWTLLFVGRRRRTWGYWRPMHRKGGWTWDEFDKDVNGLAFDQAMKVRRGSA